MPTVKQPPRPKTFMSKKIHISENLKKSFLFFFVGFFFFHLF